MAENADLVNEYDSILAEDADQSRMAQRSSLFGAMQDNPDEFAQARKLAKKSGLPAEAIRTNKDQVQQDVTLSEYDKLLETHPVLAEQYKNPDFAKLAIDDSENLSPIEQGVRFLKNISTNTLAGFRSTNQGLWGVAAMGADLIDENVAKPFGFGSSGGPGPLSNPVSRYLWGLSQNEAARAQQLREFNQPLSSMGRIERSLYGGFESLGSNIATMPFALGAYKAPAELAAQGLTAGQVAWRSLLPLLPMGAQTVGQEYTKAKEKGLGTNESTAYAIVQGSTEIGTEMIPVFKFLEDVGAGTPFLKMLAKQIVAENIGEQVATMAQDFTEWRFLQPEKTFADYVNERPSAALDTFISTMATVAGQTSLIHGTTKIANTVMENRAKAGQAKAEAAQLGRVLEAAKNSKLRERDPETFAAFVDASAAAAGTEINDVYVDARTLVGVLNQAGIDQSAAAQFLPTLDEQLPTALSTGGDVRLSVGELLATLPGSAIEKELLPHIRMSPDSLSLAEADVYLQQEEKQMQDMADKALATSTADEPFQKSSEAVYQNILGQLTKANRFTGDVNNAYAKLVQNFYSTTAKRTGMTPEEMFAKYPLEIVSTSTGKEPTLRQVPPTLFTGQTAPSKSKPVVLVFGGSFNPIHEGHVQAARDARQSLVDAGYDVRVSYVVPSPQTLMDAKAGAERQTLMDRAEMARQAFSPFAEGEGFLVTDVSSREVDASGRKPTRSDAVAWAAAQHPDATVIAVAGEDTAPSPDGEEISSFPALYRAASRKGDGAHYIVMPREEDSPDNVSSSAVRSAIKEGQQPPAGFMNPDALFYYLSLLGRTPYMPIDRQLYELDAPDFGMAPAPETVPDGDPRLEPTYDKRNPQASLTSMVVFNGKEMTRRQMWDLIKTRMLVKAGPPPTAPNRTAHVLAGGGGSGKSTVRRTLGLGGEGFVHVDADDIKLQIPEYEALRDLGDSRAADVVHAESAALARELQTEASRMGYGLVLDSTMRSVAAGVGVVKALKAEGYSVNVVGVTTRPEVALVRARRRAEAEGRYVPNQNLLAAHKGFAQAFAAIAEVADSAALYDNTDGPVRVATRADDGTLAVANKMLYDDFAQRSEVNERARTFREVSGFGVGNPQYQREDLEGGEGPGGGRTVGVAVDGSGQDRIRIGQDGLGQDGGSTLAQGPNPTSDVGHKREKSTGRYVGAPDWVGSSPQQLAQLRKKLRQLTTEGAVGRFWYENSSKAILEMAGGDIDEAEKIVSLIAIYSPNATVPANTSMALTAWYQYKAGLPIDAGFGENDKKAENLLRHGDPWSGIKTNSFYQNLMVEIDATKLNPDVATMDMWMAIAFDYGSKSLDQGPKYKFAEREIAAIAAELGWKAHQVQAAVWTAMKGRVDPIRKALQERELALGIGHMIPKVDKETGKTKMVYDVPLERKYDHFRLAHKMGMDATFDTSNVMTSKYDFGDALRQRAAQISWEATPGATTGLLPELLAGSLQDKIDYLKDITDVVSPGGKDLIAEAVGLPPGNTLFGFSAWQGDVGAGAQTFTPVPMEGKTTKDRAVKGPAREIMNLYAAVRGFVLSQEAVVWQIPVYDDAKIRQNGFEVVTTNALSAAEMRTLYDALHREFGTWELAPGYTASGVRILNFVEGLDNKDFQKRVTKVLESMDGSFGGGVVDLKAYRADSDYISNNWAAAPNGEQYASRIAAATVRGQGRSDLLSWATDLRARVAEVNAAWEEKLAARPRDELAQSGVGATSAELNQNGAAQTDTPEFKAWFGDSKVVDDKGAPMVVYHGTASDITEFDDRSIYEGGIYFTADPRYASGRARIAQLGGKGEAGNVIPAFVRISNPAPEGLTVAQAKEQGYDGFIRDTEVVAFSPDQVKSAIGNNGSFDPNDPSIVKQGETATRGTYSPTKMRISLLQNADLSTFLHETGHHFLEVLGTLADQPNASPEIIADFNTLLAWFGVPDVKTWRDMTFEGRRPLHEKFAEGFEEYLFEGKAPNTEMQGVFNRFRSWMTNVYKSLQDFLRTHKNDLTPEVRQVMDRLIATDEQIASAEHARNMIPLFESAKDAGMTESEWLAYQELGKEASETATEQLNRRSMADMKYASRAKAAVLRALQAEVKEKRAAVRAEIEAEAKLEPVYQVQHFLSRGELLDLDRSAKQRRILEAFAGVNVKLDTAALKEMYGDGPAAPWRYLATGRWGVVTNKEGVHPDVIAELFGFSSGDELVKALLAAEKFNDVVDARTDVRMLERYGDLSNPDTLNRAADEAIHNNVRIRFVATELRALSKGMNPRVDTGRVDAKGRKITYNPLIQGAKEAAERAVARRRLRDIRPGELMAAEERASRKSAEAKAANDLPAALTHKRNQLLNLYGAKAAMAAINEVETAVNYLRKFSKEGTRKSLDVEYLDQIDAMLERFDLRKGQSLKAIDKRSKLKDWITAQEAAGMDPLIDDDLRDEAFRMHFRDMTLEQFRGLVDAVRNIEHLGRLKKKLLTSKDQREFDAAVAEIVTSIESNAKRRVPQPIELTKWERMKRGVDSFFAMHRKVSSLARQLDGFKEGPLWDYFVNPMNEAANNEARMREESSVILHAIFRPVLTGEKMSSKRHIPEIGTSLSREARLSVALNWGNLDNRQRLMDGYGWNEKQVEAILDTLNQEDWTFVQQTWEHLNSYWQRIADKERRVSGVVPERVVASPFMTKFGEVTGGYYPIKENSRLSVRAASHDAAEVARNMLRGAYTRATTRRGHTMARAESVKNMPLDLTFNVITGHLTQVTHDLAWHEWLIDANRLMRDPKIAAAISATHGDIVLNEITALLPDIAAGDVAGLNAWEATVGHLRVGATVAALGYNLSTALMQPLGFSQSIVRIGPGWVAKGIVRFLGTPKHMTETLAEIQLKSDFMRLRAKTMQREINEIRNTIDSKMSVIQGSFFYMIGKMQQVVDVPTWLGAYEKEFAASGDEARAVSVADQAVADSQGAGQIKDLARIQRGGPLMKLWTNFYSFFSTTYNLASERTKATNFSNPTEVALLAVDYMLLTIVPASMGALLKMALRGGDDDEESVLKALIAENMSYLLGMMIGLREVTFGLQKALGVNTYKSDYAGPAGIRFLQAFDKLGQEVGDGDIDVALLKAANNVGGVVFHYPSGQVNRTVAGAAAMYSGDTKNPGVLLVGP